MPTSDKYRELSETCYRLANEATTDADRTACLDLAQTLLDAASQGQELTAEQIAAARKLELMPDSAQPRARSIWRRLFGSFRP